MTYEEWFLNQGKEHQKIITKLKDYNIDEIIDYFKFENMVINEPNFCLLYKENKKCHNIENLNCYLCACPYFRFNDKGLKNKRIKYYIHIVVLIQKMVQNLNLRILYIMIVLIVLFHIKKNLLKRILIKIGLK
ncbi:conserved hypothetical protein [Aliarcobacter butzleri JV22]|nr:conserved hypothetical protein [Aliarcobacter butzleri JV22]